MSLVTSDYLLSAKRFLRMDPSVTSYDEEINGLIDAAILTLRIAGITKPTALVKDYINAYVRLAMLQDKDETFARVETQRMHNIMVTLIYGGEDSV